MAEPPVEVWPENWPAIALLLRMGTQWRIGFNGRTGLDYNVLLRFMDRMGLSDAEYDDMLDDVRTLESEALNTMNKG